MKLQKQIVWVACIVALGISGWLGWTYFNNTNIALKNPTGTPSKIIKQTSKLNPADNQSDDQSSQNAEHEKPNSPDSRDASYDSDKLATHAPKQKEISDKTPHEYLYKALAMPNDPYVSYGNAFNYTKAPQAWNKSTGSPITIAVIDTGFALNHEDLSTQWQINTEETGTTKLGDTCWSGAAADKSSNDCDDDKNGYVDDWRGWDFANVDNRPLAGETNPAGSAAHHGTAVAGVAGAASNNGRGSASYNWNAKLLPLQVLDDNGFGFTSQIAAAIFYAVDNGAKVVNLSLGSQFYDTMVQRATDYAYQKGVLVVAASGNCGTGREPDCDPNKPGQMGYPALNPHVLSVGASDNNGGIASFSSYGPGLDVIAPGSGALVGPIWREYNQNNAYTSDLYGTSFAAPMVASLASLVMSYQSNMTVDEITGIIDGTAQKPAGMNGQIYTNQYGHGVIDADAATNVAISVVQATASPVLGQTGGHISEHAFTNTSLMSSGCTTTANAYCTIWAQDEQRIYDRYLPYTKTNSLGQAGWSWPGSTLGDGLWRLRAVNGQHASSSYLLFQK